MRRRSSAETAPHASITAETAASFAGLDCLTLDVETLITKLQQQTSALEQQNLATRVRTSSKTLERGIEELKQLAEEQDREVDRDAILKRLAQLEQHYKQLQFSFRKALLNAKTMQQKQAQMDRESLLRNSKGQSGDELLRNRRAVMASRPDATLQTTFEITESLKRTTRLMGEEVDRSAYAAKVLDESSRALQETRSEYRNLAGVLHTSKTLLTRLEQRDWTDRLLILFGLLVFVLVVLYILKKRMWIPGFSTGWNLVGYLWDLISGYEPGLD